MAEARRRSARVQVRVDFEEHVRDPLLDIDNDIYLDADGLPLSATSKHRLRHLQTRWQRAANECNDADAEDPSHIDDSFARDLKEVELRVRRELAGTSRSLVIDKRRKGARRDRPEF